MRYPVFVNTYSRSRSAPSTTVSVQNRDAEIPEIPTPLEDKPEIPVETLEEIPEVIPRGVPEEPEGFTVPEILTPLSIMPQTNVEDSMIKVWMYGLCCSVMGLGILCLIIKRAKRTGKN